MNTPHLPRVARVFYRRSNRLVHRAFPNENTLLLALAFVVGVGSGLGALGFEMIIEAVQHLSEQVRHFIPLDSLYPGLGNLLVLVLGGLVGGLLITTVAAKSKGHGVPDVMASVAIRGGRIQPSVAGETALTAGVCIGAGGSAGPEGPIVQIGSAIGSAAGQFLRMSTERMRILAACGAAGGISAIFGAPLAGVMFAVEVVLGDFGVRSLTAIVVSSVLAAVTHQAFVSWEPRFEVPPHGLIGFNEVPLLILLGLLAGVASWLFIKVLYWTEDRFQAMPAPALLKPVLGMFGVGVLAIWLPEVLGDGYDSISEAMNGRLVWWVMAMLVFAKLAATCLTVGSGNVGGLFAPSMVIGAMMGGAFGVAAELIFPGQSATVALYALVGMAALIAGTTHATIASILLIFEITNDYALVLPVMLASATAVVLASWLSKQSIYTLKLSRDGIRLDRGVEVNVMSSITVSRVMRAPEEVVPADMHFNGLLDLIGHSTANTFAVVEGDRLTGVLSYQDIRIVLTEAEVRSPEMNMLVVAGDIATPEPQVVLPGESLNDAMRLYGLRDLSTLPVVESRESMRLVGLLHRRDVLNAYRRALMSGRAT